MVDMNCHYRLKEHGMMRRADARSNVIKLNKSNSIYGIEITQLVRTCYRQRIILL